MVDKKMKKSYRIDGFEQIKNFYSIVFGGTHALKTYHIALYFLFFNQNNRLNWCEWFRCPLDIAINGSKIGSKVTYYKALNELQRFGLISYRKGKNQISAPYIKLTRLTKYGKANVPLSEPADGLANEPALLLAIGKALGIAVTPANVLTVIPRYNNIITETIKTITNNGLMDLEYFLNNYKNKIKEDKKEEIQFPFRQEKTMVKWMSFLKMREKKNKSLETREGHEGMLRKLVELSLGNEKTAQNILEQSISNEWIRLYPIGK